MRRSREEDLTSIEETACIYRAAGYDKQGRAVIVFIGKWFRQSQVNLFILPLVLKKIYCTGRHFCLALLTVILPAKAKKQDRSGTSGAQNISCGRVRDKLFFAGRPGQGAPLPSAGRRARRGRRVRCRVLPHEDAARQHPLLLVDQADLQHVALQVQEESQGERTAKRERG